MHFVYFYARNITEIEIKLKPTEVLVLFNHSENILIKSHSFLYKAYQTCRACKTVIPMHSKADSAPSVTVNVPFGQMVQTVPSSLSLYVPLGQLTHLGLIVSDSVRYVPTGHGTINKMHIHLHHC